MIPYDIRLILNESKNDTLTFQSNEKPVKGDVFTIQEKNENWEAKITDVTKILIRDKNQAAKLEYHCKVEKHDAQTISIGFGKRG